MLTKEHLWLGLPVFFVLWKNFQFPLPLVDFWWHLKMGEVILTTGSIPDTDVFSYTMAGEPFVVQNYWLAEIAYYVLYRFGGPPLVVGVNALVGVAAFLLLYLLCLEATPRVRLAVAVGIAAALSIPGTIRPQVFSFAMFSFYYWVLAGYRRRTYLVWALPPLMVLWVNLHGAFVLGLVLVAVFVAGEGVRRAIHREKADVPTPGELKRLALVLAACLLATLVNPEGYKIYEDVRTIIADPAVQQLVSEWQPPRINDASGIIVFFLPFFLTTLALIYARTEPNVTELALFVGFGIFGLMSLRNGPWFSIVAYPMFVRYASDTDNTSEAVNRLPFVNRLLFAFRQPSRRQPVRPGMNLLVASMAVFVLVLQTPWVRPTLYKTSLLQAGTPAGAMDFIAQHNLEGNIFHPQMFGDYLIWRLWPGHKSFIDGRVHVFDLDFVVEYLSIYRDADWKKLVEKWDVRYLLLSKSSTQPESIRMAESARQSSQWRTLYEDDVSVLLEHILQR